MYVCVYVYTGLANASIFRYVCIYVYVYLTFTNITCKRYDIKVINCNLKIFIHFSL